ncbi:MAG TPA: MMPL family transporter, partial [Chloroflexota bacterium]|nr:MMPL family transporter [Chloroflexota bacterium]
GRAAFWPSNVRPGPARIGLWGKIAGNIVRYPAPTLVAGIVVFGALAVAALHYAPEGFTQNGSTATSSQSTQGTAVIAAHFPAAQSNPNNLLLAYGTPVWRTPRLLTAASTLLVRQAVFRSVSGPLDPNGSHLTVATLVRLHQLLGPAFRLPPVPPGGTRVSPALYNAYRSTSQFISADGRTVQFYATLRAGAADTTPAMQATPDVRQALGLVASRTGAVADGVAGQAAISYDISNASTSDLQHIVPVVLVAIGILLALVLRSLVAPLYLIASVGLSYLAALGLAVVVFMVIGGGPGLNFILPFFMFIFLMALGEDYNILVMTRLREEAHYGTLPAAVTRAINATGSTVTSAGMVLAGTFAVLAFVGSGQIQQIGFAISAGILMDTFLVRTLLIPSTVSLLGRWNWWPAHLAAEPLPAGSLQ